MSLIGEPGPLRRDMKEAFGRPGASRSVQAYATARRPPRTVGSAPDAACLRKGCSGLRKSTLTKYPGEIISPSRVRTFSQQQLSVRIRAGCAGYATGRQLFSHLDKSVKPQRRRSDRYHGGVVSSCTWSNHPSGHLPGSGMVTLPTNLPADTLATGRTHSAARSANTLNRSGIIFVVRQPASVHTNHCE